MVMTTMRCDECDGNADLNMHVARGGDYGDDGNDVDDYDGDGSAMHFALALTRWTTRP